MDTLYFNPTTEGYLIKTTNKLLGIIPYNQGLALREYSGYSSMSINNCLRFERTCSLSTKRYIALITQALHHSTTKIPLKVYRGVPNKVAKLIQGSKVGQTLTDRGFISTSLSSNIASSFNARTVTIFIPEGSMALYTEPFKTNLGSWGESEVLLPRNSKFKVVDPNHLILQVVK